MSDPVKTLEIGVGLVLDDQRKKVLLTWNDKWQGFAMPMSKIKTTKIVKESAEASAVRAVAEALHLPAQVASGRSAQRTHRLSLSQGDGQMKGYNYHIAEIEIHPDYRAVSREDRPIIWATIDSILDEKIGPLTWSLAPILEECRELEWI